MSSRIFTGKLGQAMCQARLIGLQFSRHENETRHTKAETNDRNVFDAVFEDDVDRAVERGRVGGPPEVDPVIVHLPTVISEGLGEGHGLNTWWFAIRTRRSAKLHFTVPSGSLQI